MLALTTAKNRFIEAFMSVFADKKRLGILEEDLCALRRRIDELESGAKLAKLESAEVYEKTLRLMQRMAKRYAVDIKENGGDPPEIPGNSPLDSLDPISRSIMLRRGGYRSGQ